MGTGAPGMGFGGARHLQGKRHQNQRGRRDSAQEMQRKGPRSTLRSGFWWQMARRNISLLGG